MKHRNWNLLFGLLLVWTTTLPSRADDGSNEGPPPDALTRELQVVARDFALIVKGQGGGVVSVGSFSPLDERDGSVGPRIQLILEKELTKLGTAVGTTEPRFTINGNYSGVTDKDSGLFGVKLICRLIARQEGDQLAEKSTGRFVFGSQTVPDMLLLNTSGAPTTDPQVLSARFADAATTPQVDVIGTKLQGKTGQYAIELLVKMGNSYVAQPLKVGEQGRPFANLQPDDIFGVRLINNSPHEAAVDLCIDGVNCFAFNSTGGRYWILAPGQQLDVIGWQQNDQMAKEFKVVAEFPDSAAAKLNLQPSEAIGVIGVTFCACWEPDASPPADEKTPGTRSAGFGGDVTVVIEKVSRIIGQPRDSLVLRYERRQPQ